MYERARRQPSTVGAAVSIYGRAAARRSGDALPVSAPCPMEALTRSAFETAERNAMANATNVRHKPGRALSAFQGSLRHFTTRLYGTPGDRPPGCSGQRPCCHPQYAPIVRFNVVSACVP
jgi:hypothetical protein